MSPVDPSSALALAFSIASGREPARADDGTGESVAPELLAFARRIVAHGRTIVADTPCPRPLLRRAEALFTARRTAVGAALWALLFDSSASLSPASLSSAIRGTSRSRFLRIGGEGGAIEAELTGLGTDEVRLVGALEAPRSSKAPATIVLEPSRGAAVRAPVGDGGTFDLRVPVSARSFTLSVRVGRRVVARSARLDLRPENAAPGDGARA